MNLLGGTLENRLAFDLFGGSGVLAFEAISRGASHAWVWEILKPGARIIQKIAVDLGISDQVTVLDKDVLRWTQQWSQEIELLNLTDEPWVVFCCPPYAMWETQGEEIRELLETWVSRAPVGSLFAVELEYRTDLSLLPKGIPWQVRTYAPAQMAIGEVT
jgi:16S rRNA G966 N2-methylase RsmD